jgi:hypothetical protein
MDEDALGEFWKKQLATAGAAILVPLMQAQGVPTGKVDKTHLYQTWFERVARPEVANKPVSFLPVTVPVDKGALSDTEKVSLALAEVHGFAPMTDLLPGADGPTALLPLCVYGGLDHLAAHLFSGDNAPAPTDWQAWTVPLGKLRVPLLHRLAGTERAGLLAFLCGRPGVDLNQKDARGKTALFHARSEQAVRVLVDAGADVTLTDREGRDLLAAWATARVPEKDLDAMKKVLLAASTGFDGDQAFLQELAAKAAHATHVTLNSWYYPGKAKWTDPVADWARLGARRFSRVVGAETLSLTAADVFALAVLETQDKDDIKALHLAATTPRHAHGLLAIASVLNLLLPHQPAPVHDGSGIDEATALLAVGFLPEYKDKTLPVRHWSDRWQAGFASDADHLSGMLALLQRWNPVMYRTGQVTKAAQEWLFQSVLNRFPPARLTTLWNEGTDEAFWQTALRHPVLSVKTMEHWFATLQPTGPDPFGPGVTDARRAALYSALTTRWVLVENERYRYQPENTHRKAIEKVLVHWLDTAVPWVAHAEDYKWGKSAPRFDNAAHAQRIQAIVNRGRLDRKVASLEEEAPPPPTRKRL